MYISPREDGQHSSRSLINRIDALWLLTPAITSLLDLV